jgi:hypothetical protein
MIFERAVLVRLGPERIGTLKDLAGGIPANRVCRRRGTEYAAATLPEPPRKLPKPRKRHGVKPQLVMSAEVSRAQAIATKITM